MYYAIEKLSYNYHGVYPDSNNGNVWRYCFMYVLIISISDAADI